MSRRIPAPWIVFVAGVLLVAGGLAVTTRLALRLETQKAEAAAERERETADRLALWRMDSLLTPLLARESARPYFHYRPFHAADRAYTRMYEEVGPGEVLVASPLLELSLRDLPGPLGPAPNAMVRLHYEVGTDGRVSSPQAPAGNMRDLAESRYVTADRVIEAEARRVALFDLMLHEGTRRVRDDLVLVASSAEPAGSIDADQDVPADEYDAAWSIAGDMPEPSSASAEAGGRDPAAGDAEARSAGTPPPAPGAPEQRRSQKLAAETAGPAGGGGRGRGSGTAGRAAGAEDPAGRRGDYQARREMAQRALGQSPEENRAVAEPAAETMAPPPPATTSRGPVASDETPGVATKTASGRRAAAPGVGGGGGGGGAAAGRGSGPAADGGASSEPEIGSWGDIATNIGVGFQPVPSDPTGGRIGPLVPRWLVDADGRPELVIEREVWIGGDVVRQGLWLEWRALRSVLLDAAGELDPGATLMPVVDGATASGDGGFMLARVSSATASPPDPVDDTRRLATIPLALVLPSAAPARVTGLTAIRGALLLAWLAAAGAAVAIGLVLRAAFALGERRGRFVSAVTHELRTPITTFQLYSEMLARDVIRDPDVRSEYLDTLERESRRLGRIVENVLAYARLDRRSAHRLRAGSKSGPGPADREPAAKAGEIIDRVLGSAGPRVRVAGLEPRIQVADAVRDARLNRAAADAMEQILANLVENAIRHASPGDVNEPAPLEVVLEPAPSGRGLLRLSVRDHGPGIDADEACRVFEPFQQGRHGAASGAGLGLGLALSRALAREAGGDLRVDRTVRPGVRLVLELPSVA